MKDCRDLTQYAALNGPPKDPHTVVIVDREGCVVADFELAHSLQGWKSFAEKLPPSPTWPSP